MKIGLICDLHMSDAEKSVQYRFFTQAVEQFKKDGIDTVINLGDISSFGEYDVLLSYLDEMKAFNHFFCTGKFRCQKSRYRTDV